MPARLRATLTAYPTVSDFTHRLYHYRYIRERGYDHSSMDQSIFDAAGGMTGIRRLAEAWHARVMADELVSHAFSHGFHPQHTERLAAYWAEALGGPAGYSEAYDGETSVVRTHSGNGVHEEMDRRRD